MAAQPWACTEATSGLAKWLGYDGVFLGLRRQESVRRAGILRAAADIVRDYWHINPLIEWSDDDVWDYIEEHGLAYCTAYDRLSQIGVSRHRARLGPLPLSDGKHLWKGWPNLYVELIKQYGKRWVIPGKRKPHDMDNLTWLDLQDALQPRAAQRTSPET